MKTYSLKTLGTSHSLPIPMDGTNFYVNFEKNYSGERLAYFNTDNEKLQKAIEESQFWKSGEIKLVGKVKETDEAAVELAEQKAKEEADKAAAELAEQKAKEEAEKAAVELAEQKAKEEAEKATAELAEQKAKEEAEKAAAELAEQKAKEEAEKAPKPAVHAEVTKFQEAKKILTAEPYKVAFQALGSPEKILKKAAELGISFPNLKTDEE